MRILKNIMAKLQAPSSKFGSRKLVQTLHLQGRDFGVAGGWRLRPGAGAFAQRR